VTRALCLWLWLCAAVLGAGQSSCMVLRIYPPNVTVSVSDGQIDNRETATTVRATRWRLLDRLFDFGKKCD